MPINYPTDAELLRGEIAATAARMIAEDGADYGSAKRKAAKQILGDTKLRGDYLPDNAQIEQEVKLYHELFFSDSQPARLLHLQKLALELMQQLAEFNPHLTGAVLHGTAGAHSDIHLQLFADSAKEVQIHLLNLGFQFEVSETAHFRHAERAIETVSLMWRGEGVHLALYETDDLRGALKVSLNGRAERINVTGLQALIAAGNLA